MQELAEQQQKEVQELQSQIARVLSEKAEMAAGFRAELEQSGRVHSAKLECLNKQLAEVAGRERGEMTEEVNEQVDEEEAEEEGEMSDEEDPEQLPEKRARAQQVDQEEAEEEGNKSDGEDPEAKRARTCTPTTGTS